MHKLVPRNIPGSPPGGKRPIVFGVCLFSGLLWCCVSYDAYAEAIKVLGIHWWGILTAHGKVSSVDYLGQLGKEDGIIQKAARRARRVIIMAVSNRIRQKSCLRAPALLMLQDTFRSGS